MKKTATGAVLAALSSVAGAQTQVLLFGIVDEAVRYVENGGQHMYSLASGGISTSRIGFRGTEELGGTLKAAFWLEAGINADTGTSSDPTTFFNRRSTVGLLGDLGELRLGRDYTPTYLGYTEYDAFTDNGIAAAGKFDSNLGSSRLNYARSSNQVMYLLPTGLGGIYGRAAVAAGEGVSGGKYVGGRLGYAGGPLDVSVAYGQTWVTPVRGDHRFRVFDIGAAYDFKVFKPVGYYTVTRFAGQRVATFSIGALAPAGSHGQLKAQYTRANVSGSNPANGTSIDANDAQQFAVGYIYNLSKRTALYSTAAYVKNKANATFAVATAPALAPGRNSRGIEAGIRHSF